MKTDDLIEALALGVEPVRPARPALPWLALAALLAVLAVVVLLGVRSDISEAMRGAAFWLKAAYTAGLTASGLWLATRLGRPGLPAGAATWAFAVLVGLALVAGATELIRLQPDQRMDAWLGFTWRICSLNILKVGALAAPLVWLSARGLAPTRPMLSGAALGAATGGMAATAYGLHCPEATAAFVATWYTLGIAAAAVLGALLGRYALRW